MHKNNTTKQRIIEVAAHLFLTKGYDHTTVADILDNLDGLTKGAIYHHFDGKEAIFNAVVEHMGNQHVEVFDSIKYNRRLNGAEKLSKILHAGFDTEAMETITDMAPSLVENPKLLSSFFIEMRDITIPEYILPIIKEGVYDGSIKTEYANELAEMVAVLVNIWLNPLMFTQENSNLPNKMRLLNKVLESFQVKLFDV